MKKKKSNLSLGGISKRRKSGTVVVSKKAAKTKRKRFEIVKDKLE